MNNKNIELHHLVTVAKVLAQTNHNFVFVGGVVLGLYVNDDFYEPVRLTQDIDIALEISGYGKWISFVNIIQKLGFKPDPEGPSICRYLFKDIKIDLIPTHENIAGFTNKWYGYGISHLETRIFQEVPFRILQAPYYLATKFEAFRDRGKGDYRTSHDFEDVIYIINNRNTLVNEILLSDTLVKSFLQEECKSILKNKYSEEIITCHLNPFESSVRYPIILNRLKSITKE